MNENVKNVLVILAGGNGSRYKADVPKQYTLLKGKEVLVYSIEEMEKSAEQDKIVVVLNNNEEAMAKIKLQFGLDVISGGKDRAHSFQNALDFIQSNYPACKKVVFHESARPLIEHEVIDEYFRLLDEYDFVESCKRISDSLGSYVTKAPRREDYYLIQAPEAYRLSVLTQYYDCESDVYFAANQFPDFVKGYQYFEIKNNIKLTTPEDKALIEYLIDN